MEKELDIARARADLEANGLLRGSEANRLSFADRCRVLACFLMGARHANVTKVFGVTITTASYIANCAKPPQPGRINRYREVARELERWGENEFVRRYYTDELHDKLMRIKYAVPQPLDNRTPSSSNPRASAKAFSDLPGTFAAGGQHWRVDWVEDGWRFSHCEPNGDSSEGKYPGYMYQGQDALGGPAEPFRTSALAYDAVFKAMGEK